MLLTVFNSLKNEYQKQNIFTMEDLIDRLNQLESVTVIPTGSGDFWDYDSLLYDMYRDLLGQVKIYHIFSCSSNDLLMMMLEMRWSNLPKHGMTIRLGGSMVRRRLGHIQS
jgi:hypothetical protein